MALRLSTKSRASALDFSHGKTAESRINTAFSV